MELYKKSDLELIEQNVESIVNKIEENKKKIFNIVEEDTVEKDIKPKPEKEEITLDTVKDIVEIILDFVKRKKRKIYGGYSQNKAILLKNPKDAFYDTSEVPDIDVYSPDPIGDLIEISDILHKKGFKNVSGSEAINEGTYKVFANGYNAIDLSYVSQNIFNKIPYIESNEIRYIHPHFAMIDLFRMISEPYFSSWRWHKTFPRIFVLQKNYPFNKATKKVPQISFDNTVQPILDIILGFIKNRKTIYCFGAVAFNQFYKASGIKGDIFKEIDVPFYQFVSVEYQKDVNELIDKLKENKHEIEVVEHYPLWHFLDYSTRIYYKKELVAEVYRHLHQCIPVKKVKVDTTGFIQIACFDFMFMMELINSFRAKIDNNSEKIHYYNITISHLIEMRSYYFRTNKKTLLDDSLFQSMITDCIGEARDPIISALEKRKKKKDAGKRAVFRYYPVAVLKHKWVFANTSGNKINNPKNLKLNKK